MHLLVSGCDGRTAQEPSGYNDVEITAHEHVLSQDNLEKADKNGLNASASRAAYAAVRPNRRISNLTQHV